MSGGHHELLSTIPTNGEEEQSTAAPPVDLPQMEVELPSSSHVKDTLIHEGSQEGSSHGGDSFSLGNDPQGHPSWWADIWGKHQRLICLSTVGLMILSTVVAIVIVLTTKQKNGQDHGLSWDGGGTRGDKDTTGGILDRTYVYPKPIPQSPSDTRTYRFLTLPNSLDVTLVRDATSPVGAAAMDVAAGSANDPKDVQGLAHFLEHMLFYGSVKYPNEGEYSNFLTLNGGTDNAYTANDHTNYYFEVNNEVLPQALDRFAHFFIDPLLTLGAVSREVNAVNSEHTKNLNSDEWREEQLINLMASPGSQMNHFGTGSLQTLLLPRTASLLHRAVVEFYNTHYTSASRMKLTVLAPQSLDILQRWVEQIFIEIPKTNLAPYSDPPQLPAFPSGSLPLRVHVAPVSQTMRVITVVFALDFNVGTMYQSQVAEYIEYLHGSVHNESLYYCLRDKGIVDKMEFELYDKNSYASIFMMKITLTQAGAAQYENVYRAYYDFIKVLQSATVQRGCQIWEDYVAIKTVTYRWQSSKLSASDTASALAANMNMVGPGDLLGSPSTWSCKQEDLVAVINTLQPSAAMEFVWFGATDPGTLPLTDPNYGTKYNRTKRGDIPTDGKSIQCPILLGPPSPNTAIPKDFTILPSIPMVQPTNITATHVSGGIPLWWQRSRYYATEPKIDFRCKIRSGSLGHAAREAVMVQLYQRLVNDYLEEATSDARSVGMDYTFLSDDGINMRIGGYHDSASQLVRSVFEVIPIAKVKALANEARFQILKSQYLQDLDDVKHNPLYRLVAQYFRVLVLQSTAVALEDQESELRNVTLDDVWNTLDPKLYLKTNVVCMGFGNMDQSQVAAMTQEVLVGVGHTTQTSLEDTPAVSLLQCDPGTDVLLYSQPFVKEDTNEVVMMRYEIEGFSYATAAVLQKLIGNRCFDELRTKQQLGYVVWCYVTREELRYRTALSFFIVVQSGVYNSSLVMDRCAAFLEQTFMTELQGVDSVTFGMAVNGVITALKETPLSLTQEADSAWAEIVNGRLRFQRKNETIAEVQNVTLDDVRALYKATIADATTRRRTTIAVGQTTPTSGLTSRTTLVDIRDVKKLSEWKKMQRYAP